MAQLEKYSLTPLRRGLKMSCQTKMLILQLVKTLYLLKACDKCLKSLPFETHLSLSLMRCISLATSLSRPDIHI